MPTKADNTDRIARAIIAAETNARQQITMRLRKARVKRDRAGAADEATAVQRKH